jgi:uridine phosphorylase
VKARDRKAIALPALKGSCGILKDERQYHIRCRPGDVGRYVLLPGDPGRCDLVAEQFDDPVLVSTHREYRTFTGTLLGESVSVTSTGIGCPSAAIAVEELAQIGADTFIRVGTAGGMQAHLGIGDLVITTGAVRDEGTSRQYIPLAFPAVADMEVTWALREAARQLNYPHHVGIVHSKDSFYGQHEPERMPAGERLRYRWRAWIQGGALCSEMEAATIFVLASILRKRAGCVAVVAGNQERDGKVSDESFSLAPLILTAVQALRLLIVQDRAQREPRTSLT